MLARSLPFPVDCTKKLLHDEQLSHLVLVFIHKIATLLNDSDRFDISVLALIVLINMFVIERNLARAARDDGDLEVSRAKREQLLKARPAYLLNQVDCGAHLSQKDGQEDSVDSFEIVFKVTAHPGVFAAKVQGR